MKKILPQPIGNLRDVGTPRAWLVEALIAVAILGLVAAALILLPN